MSPAWVVLAYGSSLALALLLLFWFHARAWYWHALSVALALVIGLTPMAPELQSAQSDLGVGSVFVFLLLWGACAPLTRYVHIPHAR